MDPRSTEWSVSVQKRGFTLDGRAVTSAGQLRGPIGFAHMGRNEGCPRKRASTCLWELLKTRNPPEGLGVKLDESKERGPMALGWDLEWVEIREYGYSPSKTTSTGKWPRDRSSLTVERCLYKMEGTPIAVKASV